MGTQKNRLSTMEKQYPRIDLKKNASFQFRLKFYKGSKNMPDWMRKELREGLIADGGIDYVNRVDLEKLDSKNK